MSRSRGGLLSKLFDNFVKSIKPLGSKEKIVGTDYLGNTYYEVIPTKNSHRTRASRYYLPKNKDETKFDEPIPAEWEAWLRLRRREPPTAEEIARNLELMRTKKINAAELDRKFAGGGEKLSIGQGEQVVTGIKDFPSYEEYEKFPGQK
ncbi:unnamed protein product [Nesidiocoris tenuis]|uniref:NADH dehydrogenase [ubiquinone] 1 alpha subcomplex assembly factor 2 n=1 Tax=Nesidiocoris tenuis TaxID=355587 RepID=A0A6H5GST5_9HEMI|nr:unnamed protein product [Nesidiocoris tenuis]